MRILRWAAKAMMLAAKVLHGRQAGSGAVLDHRRAIPAQGGRCDRENVKTRGRVN